MQIINALVKTQVHNTKILSFVLKLDRWSLPLSWHMSDISAVCNFWPQLQILGGSADPLTRPYRASVKRAAFWPVQILLTLAVSVAVCERWFLKLKLIVGRLSTEHEGLTASRCYQLNEKLHVNWTLVMLLTGLRLQTLNGCCRIGRL